MPPASPIGPRLVSEARRGSEPFWQFDEEPERLTRRTAGLLQPPPNTQGPKPTMRRSTFKEVRRAVA